MLSVEYKKELVEIQKMYLYYKSGATFYSQGTSGDYVASNVHYKLAKTLINKEARFMFSKPPEISIKGTGSGEETEKNNVAAIQKLVNIVLKKSKFQSFQTLCLFFLCSAPVEQLYRLVSNYL